MGCWNETDALTKLPIVEDEAIVLFVLETLPERYNKVEVFLNEDLYQPVGLPFYGTYDDYGSINLDPNFSEYHQRFPAAAQRKPDEDPQEFLRGLTRREVGNSRLGGAYSQMMVKHSVWESLLIELGNREYRSWSGPETYRQHFEAAIEKYLVLKAERSKNEEKDFMSRFEQEEIGQELFVRRFWHPIMSYLDGEVTDQVRENVVNLLLTHHLLRALRLGWSPQFGSGSQDMETELTASLARSALVEINVLKSRYEDDEDYEDYDDEDDSSEN